MKYVATGLEERAVTSGMERVIFTNWEMKLLLDQHLTKAAQFHLASLLRGKDNGFVQITNSFLQFEFLKVSKLEGLKVWCFFSFLILFS